MFILIFNSVTMARNPTSKYKVFVLPSPVFYTTRLILSFHYYSIPLVVPPSQKKCIPRLIQSLHSIPFVRWCFRHDLLLQKCLPICGPTISFLSVRTNDEHLFPLSTPLLINSFLCYFVLSSVHSFIQYLTQSNSFCLQRRSVLFRNMVWCGDGQEQSDEK